MPAFAGYVGIDYSGAQTPTASLRGLRVYLAEGALRLSHPTIFSTPVHALRAMNNRYTRSSEYFATTVTRLSWRLSTKYSASPYLSSRALMRQMIASAGARVCKSTLPPREWRHNPFAWLSATSRDLVHERP